MSLVGGLRTNIRDYDFKYTMDNNRKNWIKSVYPNLKTLVNVVRTIPYDTYAYTGDIIYTVIGIPKTESIYTGNTSITELYLDHNKVACDNKMSIYYNFFGGICFELLNDYYTDVNLYDFVDPTSDIDISLSSKLEKSNSFDYKLYLDKYSDIGDVEQKALLVVNKTLENPELPPYLNPCFMFMSDFVFNNMLMQLNGLNLQFLNSVSFDINEYQDIDNSVKNVELGYRVENIENCNAKLVRYIDSDLKTIRIQIILKIEVNSEIIIDHLLEFLINVDNNFTNFYENWKINPIPTNISPLRILIENNLRAYNQRVSLLQTNGSRSHKPINHITRFIYLLDLIKHYPDIYNNITVNKGIIRVEIIKNMVSTYQYYKVTNNNFTINTVDTINIIYAFYDVFIKLMQNKVEVNKLLTKINATDFTVPSNDEIEYYYNSLITLFKINASPFRRMVSSTMSPPQTAGYKNRCSKKVKKSKKIKSKKIKKKQSKKVKVKR